MNLLTQSSENASLPMGQRADCGCMGMGKRRGGVVIDGNRRPWGVIDVVIILIVAIFSKV